MYIHTHTHICIYIYMYTYTHIYVYTYLIILLIMIPRQQAVKLWGSIPKCSNNRFPQPSKMVEDNISPVILIFLSSVNIWFATNKLLEILECPLKSGRRQVLALPLRPGPAKWRDPDRYRIRKRKKPRWSCFGCHQPPLVLAQHYPRIEDGSVVGRARLILFPIFRLQA